MGTLALGVLLRAAYFFQPVGGAHAFRQVHVVNDILSLKLRSSGFDLQALERFDHTWRPGLRLFDVPVFQLMAAGISDGLNVDALSAARLLQLLVYLASGVAVWVFSRRVGATPVQATLTVLVYSLLPVTIQFHVAPIPDAFMMLLGLVSWCCLQDLNAPRRLWYLGIACAGLATLMKPAAYFPFALGLVLFWYYAYRKGIWGVRSLLFGATCAFSVVAYWGFSTWFNDRAALGNELPWYFGTLEQRLSWDAWWRILRRFWFAAFGPYVGAILALLGVWAVSTRLPRKEKGPSLMLEGAVLALGLGCVLTTLVFFNVHVQHGYYQLPYAPVFGFLTVRGGSAVWGWLRKAGLGLSSTRRSGALLLVPAVVGWVVYTVRTPLLDYRSESRYISLGKSVQAGTPKDAFVFYAANFSWKDPDIKYLFFAQRHGYYTRREGLSDQLINEVRRGVPRAKGEVFIFCAGDPKFPSRDCVPWLEKTLSRWKAEVVNQDPMGVVFRLRCARPPSAERPTECPG